MWEELIDIIYEDDTIVFKQYLIAKIIVIYKYDNGKYFRINDFADTLTKEQAEFLAPLLKCVIKRTLDYFYSNGYHDGKAKGIEELQNNVKKLLNIKE